VKQIAALAIALTVSMVCSYMVWTDDSPNVTAAGDEVMIYSANPSDLTTLAWMSKSVDIVLERKADDRGEYTWVTTTERKEKAAPKVPPKPHDHDGDAPEGVDVPHQDGTEADEDDGEDDVEEAPVEIETVTTSFRGNKQAEDMWEGFAPLMALRELQPEDATEAFFGFDEPDGSIDVTRKSGTVSITIGGETFGGRDKYAKTGEKIYLLDDQSIRPLQYGKTRLLERNLQPLGEPDTASVVITTPSLEKTFVQQNRDDRAQAKWTSPEDAETEHPVGTWLGKVYKMRAKSYVSESDIEGPLDVAFTYELKGDSESWPVTILKDNASPPNYYAKPTYLRSMVELTRSLASDAVDDLAQVMAD
jgi:hypothetical protein